ncbi:UNVERIFIED_CONTAM: hypothetical protein H355_006554 [Colinus virginianus]|nr:hypothetical protein H355_006554 [Colinus virginianus]
MYPRNSSQALPFLLAGLPGMARFHPWLHQPMYYFLLMLATTDLGLTLSTLPTVLRVLWSGAMEISFPACLIQMFCIHVFSFMESSVLLAMAFDRYTAICCPLRSRVLSHPYCLHQDVIRLACTDATLNSVYGLTLVLVVILDSVLIVLSYAVIVRTVLGITSREEQAKALNTCVSHFCAVLIFYLPLAGLSIIHRCIRSRSAARKWAECLVTEDESCTLQQTAQKMVISLKLVRRRDSTSKCHLHITNSWYQVLLI